MNILMAYFSAPSVYSTILEHLYRLKSSAQADCQIATLSEYILQLQVSLNIAYY